MANNVELNYTPAQIEIFFTGESYKYLVVPKGRRFGSTKGAANAFIEYMLDGISPLLWVDTINGNIERYVDRYFMPVLKQIPKERWSWNRMKKELKINGAILDFRSADAPESIEGFGYKKIFLNEAGIILKNTYLYSNAILPMLLDYPESQLIASGVPKGKTLKNGDKHKFFELYERAKAGEEGYKLLEYTSFDNPLLERVEIEKLMMSMSKQEQDQEIFGQFVEYSGDNPFAHAFDEARHVSMIPTYNPKKQLEIAIDFNLNPFAVMFKHQWYDKEGFHDHWFDCAEIKNGSIPAMIDLIIARYKPSLPNCIITGDAMGNRGDISQRDNASYYEQLRRGLGLSQTQLKLAGNPTHENSRADCNYYLAHHPDLKIHKERCAPFINDLKNVQCDAFGSILKKDRKNLNQRADYLDCFRYDVNNVSYKWIESHQKGLIK
jgi:hypothetical protein